MPIAFRPERLLVPVITPFDDAGRVDGHALERHADEVLAAGAAGIVAVATTGEATALDDDERAAVISICARVCAARDAVLIVGAGTYNTRETIARHEALAASAPRRYGPPNLVRTPAVVARAKERSERSAYEPEVANAQEWAERVGRVRPARPLHGHRHGSSPDND